MNLFSRDFLRQLIIPQPELLPWRDKILHTLFKVGATAGVVMLIPTIYFTARQGLYGLLIFDLTMICLCWLGLWAWDRVSFQFRASAGLGLAFLLGLVILYYLGPYSGGLVWLFAFVAFTALLLGLKAAMVAIAMDLVVLVAFGLLIDAGHFPWSQEVRAPVTRWLMMGLNFMVLSGLMAFAASVLAQGLQTTLNQERAANEGLDLERRQLAETNRLLRREAEERRRSEELFRAAFENAPSGMCLFSLDGRFIQVNHSLSQMLGYAPSEILGRTFNNFTHPEDHQGGRDRLRRLLEGVEATNQGQKRYLHRDGHTVWVRVSNTLLRDDAGKPLYYVSFIWDVTEQREAILALEQSEERYRSLVEEVPFGLFVAEIPSGRFLFINHLTSEIFGYSTEVATTLTIWDVTHPSEHERMRRRITQRLEGRTPIPDVSTYTGLKADGGSLRFEVSVSLVDHEGRRAFQGFVQDVTEREGLQKQLQHAQKMEALGTLAGGVAHEFNNILTSIRGYSQSPILANHPDPRVRNTLEKIDQNTQRAAELTNTMLNYARLETGQVVPVDLPDLIKGARTLLERTLPPAITLAVDLAPDLPRVMINPHHLEQVIINLALNARDAMPQGGRLVISAWSMRPNREFLQLNPWAQSEVLDVITISDTGLGMTPEVSARVFEPFFTTKEPGKGTGLGLSVAYSMVGAHGGQIFVESAPGRGSTFTVFLPVPGEITARDEAATAPEIPAQGQQQWILVVDDEPGVREISREALSSFGYQVAEAGDGRQALEAFEQARRVGEPFELVILDLSMPVMDGAECLRRLRQMDPGVRVLVTTGLAGMTGEAEEMAQHAAGVLRKPYDLHSLIAEAGRILGA